MFRLVEQPDKEDLRPILENRDLGFMLYDLDFSNAADPQPTFFRAKIENGVISIPDWDIEEVKK